MPTNRAVPIIVGVGDVKNKSNKIEDAIEPMQLMLQAIRRALEDTNLSGSATTQLQSSIDSIDVVKTWTWPYPDLPGLLSSQLGISPRHKFYSEHGGNKPVRLLDETARRISRGESKVAVVTGGEAMASLTACAVAKRLPPPGWTALEQGVNAVFSPTNRDLGDNLGAVHAIGAPIHVYPLYENGFRAHRGQTIHDNHTESAKLYASFAKVAERNEFAWSYGKAETEESIGTITQRNRMICFPYPLLMNAFNTVNLAAACVLTSTEYAEKLGIPKDRWIFPLGGAGTQDSPNFWNRPNFYSSPSLSRSIDSALEVTGLTKDQIDYFDFYSCFPIIPKLGCEHLGFSILKPPKPITLLGGLTSFSGAGNNYSMHSVTALVRQLRQTTMLRPNQPANGLVLANGGFATYQDVMIFSSQPSKVTDWTYPARNPLPEEITDVEAPEVDDEVGAEQEAIIETYTVEFSRNNQPLRGHVIGRLKHNHHRFLANHADASTLGQLASWDVEPIGRSGWVWTGNGEEDRHRSGKRRNLFSFSGRDKGARL